MIKNIRMTKVSSWLYLLTAVICLMGIQRIGFAAENSTKSQSLVRLDADSTQLNSDMAALHARLENVHKTLWLTKNLLAVPGHLANDLRKLESELKMLDEMLNTAQAIPQLREDAKKMKQQIDPVLKEVTIARGKAEQVEHRVEPLRANIDTADNRIQKIDTNAERFRSAIPAPMPKYTEVAQTCVSKAAQTKTQCMQNAVDARGNNLVTGVNQLDQVVKYALTSVPDVRFLQQLDADFEALDSIRVKVEAVLKMTESMVGPLKELDSLLGRSFKASFPYPDPTWKNPARISHYDIKVSMRTVLNGGKAIEDQIEKILSGAMWKFAKMFGVGKLVDSIKHQAENELKQITSKLHLNQSLRIPELAKLDNVFSNIERDIAVKFPTDFGVNLPDFSLDAPSLNFRGQLINLNAIKNYMKEMAPHGISASPPTPFGKIKLPDNLCNGVSYGCQ